MQGTVEEQGLAENITLLAAYCYPLQRVVVTTLLHDYIITVLPNAIHPHPVLQTSLQLLQLPLQHQHEDAGCGD